MLFFLQRVKEQQTSERRKKNKTKKARRGVMTEEGKRRSQRQTFGTRLGSRALDKELMVLIAMTAKPKATVKMPAQLSLSKIEPVLVVNFSWQAAGKT